MLRPTALTIAATLTLALAGCPGKSRDKASEQLPPCTSFGQTCTFAPGKLGSCVQRDGCSGPNCFVCQSQH